MVEYSKVNVKVSNRQLKQLKTAVKNKTGAALRMSFKNARRKWSVSWIIIDNKKKNEAKKCI